MQLATRDQCLMHAIYRKRNRTSLNPTPSMHVVPVIPIILCDIPDQNSL